MIEREKTMRAVRLERDPTRANYSWNVGSATNVGSYHPWRSHYGLYDASGNAFEWCSDWWQSTYPSSTSDPSGPITTDWNTKVLRGGSWRGDGMYCRMTIRDTQSEPSGVYDDYGFRCAR